VDLPFCDRLLSDGFSIKNKDEVIFVKDDPSASFASPDFIGITPSNLFPSSHTL
jgi:hypothetical protein